MRTISESDREYICDIEATCFQLLQPEEAAFIRSSKTQILFRKGDNLTKQGAFASYVLYVLTGWARQYLEGDMGKSFNLRITGPGEFVGLPAVFGINTFQCSSVALADCQAILIDKEAIVKLFRANGEFSMALSRRFAWENSELVTTLQKVLYKQMNGRLAETLLYIDNIRNAFPEIFQLLSRKDLADFTGITTESAIKLLKNFEKDGLIRLEEKDIRLVDRMLLQEISRKG